ncbi:hypothetical protein FSP39_023524 [Pinctada imbricata]|uniref:SEC7 domain-containing protein n=1 Tax=Pinctada imbricata TaxID=66713 RepID=A0AA89C4D8_PINIB|nr:hypothetical protein FSP39_023524 [Pinctada imbricata]
MEAVLTQIIKDTSGPKHSAVRKSCQAALDLLTSPGQVEVTPAHVMRERCLEPLQLALETKSKKLATSAIAGIQEVLKDERFQTSMEMETEEKWLPIQILNTVITTPCLSEELQVEIMKLLLNMTFTTGWCMTAKVITKVTQVYIDVYNTSTHSVRGTVRAALTQLLSSFTEKLSSSEPLGIEDGSDVMADFNPKGNAGRDGMSKDIVTILSYLTDKLEEAKGATQNKPSIPLLLEGVYTIIGQAPSDIRECKNFQEILWKRLCPVLISLLGTPNMESRTSIVRSHSREDLGRGSGCSSSAPNLQQATAKTIYNIAVSLVDLMGPVHSLRPVLESLFHRMLLYPPPQHRLDAIKAVMELVKSPESLINLAAPLLEEGKDDFNKASVNKNPNADIALLKLIVDSVQQSCHCNDSSVCIVSVQCIDGMLGALEEVSQGTAVTEVVCEATEKYYRCIEEQDSSRKSSISSLNNDGGAVEEIKNSTENSEELSQIADASEIQEKANSSFERNKDDSDEDSEICDMSKISPVRRQVLRQHSIIKEELERRYNKVGEKCYEKVEQKNAQELVAELTRHIPRWAQLGSVTEVDEALQNFASNFCIALYNKQRTDDPESCHMAILNADGVYVAVISMLSLCLRLVTCGWYNKHTETSTPPVTEKQFMDDILGCGLLLFLSPAWLNEIYRQICQHNILQSVLRIQNSALISLIKDIDGLGSHERGGQFLTNSQSSDTNRFMLTETAKTDYNAAEAGKKFSRRVLSKLWDGVLDVLSVLLNGQSSCGITSSLALLLGTEGAREESHRAREAICMSLNGLQKAARLCCTLGLQERCGSVFYELANTSCVLIDAPKSPVPDRKATGKPAFTSKAKPVRLHASHVLSMDVVMTTGLEMGSHSADCWKHVFRCSAFISELEHKYFSQGNNQSNLPKVQQEQAPETENQDIEETELYGVSMVTAVPVAPRINVTELIKQSSIESGWDRTRTGGGVLNSVQASQVLCGLSQEVDRLFEDAARDLNLNALLDFLTELCESSQQQLHKLTRHQLEEDTSLEPPLPLNALHLYRLQEVLMKIVHSDRPLLHLIRTWSVVSTYLIEAAGHKERNVSKMAVTCVHDFILAMLSNHPELPYFHVNELLCKTFENMLCLELCDGDVQDQIVCSICELVEACTADIKSGWRPLFGALRAVKIEYTTNEEVNEARQRHIAAVLDVFDVYLNTDNVLVFANATVDCILCLLKYVRGSGCDDSSDDDSDSGSDFAMTDTAGESLCIPALGYLKQCSSILQTMWKMPACPVFNGAHRIHTHNTEQLVDPTLPHMNMEEFTRHYSQADFLGKSETQLSTTKSTPVTDPVLNCKSESALMEVPDVSETDSSLDLEQKTDSSSLKSVDSGITEITSESTAGKDSKKSCISEDAPVDDTLQDSVSLLLLQNRPRLSYSHLTHDDLGTLDTMDTTSGILHVWFLLIDGLAGSVASCPKAYQPDTLDMLFQILKSSAEVPGPTFALFCVNRLLLPMIQGWLREGVRKLGYWESGATNFKQCCGMCTDLAVDFIQQFAGDKSTEVTRMVELMLKQLLDITIECVSQPIEVISRLGCSCIRHVVLSGGNYFSESLWQISAEALQSALDVTTFHLRQLMLLFQPSSDNFYGDVAQVKVAMRRDSSPGECQRLRHLAQQVFLLDAQMSESCGHMTVDSEEDKSFVFLLYKPGEENSLNPSDIVNRIPFRNLVIGLLSNQLLLQTIGTVLLSIDSLSIQHIKDTGSTQGMLKSLSTRNTVKMLQCLRNAYRLAVEFDSRPGLKFLIQKVAKTEVAVNLYKQTGASMVFYIHTLIHICSSLPKIDKDQVKLLSNIDHYSHIDVCRLNPEQLESKEKSSSNAKLFLQLLRSICDELCQEYVDILSDETTGRADRMGEQQVFFLIAQPDDMSEFMSKKKQQKSSSKESKKDSKTSDDMGILPTETVVLQEQVDTDEDVDSSDDDTSTVISEGTRVTSTKSKRQLREERRHEARIKSFTELLCTILGLFERLSDKQFYTLLPTVYPCVNQLVCHAQDQRLRDSLGRWVHRLGIMMDFVDKK